MKITKKSILIILFVLLGASIFFVIGLFVPTKKLSGNDAKIIGIESVENLKTDYYVNEKLSVKDVKLCLQTDDDEEKIVDLKMSNITNFDTTQTGNFEMNIVYDAYQYKVAYSVEYKKIEFEKDYVMDFELNEEVDLNQYVVNVFDFYENVVEKKSLAELELSNFDLSTITTNSSNSSRKAKATYKNMTMYFDYSVFYFACKSNYIGTSEVQADCIYEILEFVPSNEGYLKIAKKIEDSGLIISLFEFDLKRVEMAGKFVFLENKSVATFDYENKILTISKGVVENEKQFDIKISKGEAISSQSPVIANIVGLSNISNRYFVGEELNISNVKAILLTTDNQRFVVDIGADDIYNLCTDDVGKFTMKVSYFKFDFYFDYVVEYKFIEFYCQNEKQNCFEFEVGSQEIFDFDIICYAVDGTPAGVRKVKDNDVLVLNFDVSSSTNGQYKTAKIICHGATLEFQYVVA